MARVQIPVGALPSVVADRCPTRSLRSLAGLPVGALVVTARCQAEEEL